MKKLQLALSSVFEVNQVLQGSDQWLIETFCPLLGLHKSRAQFAHGGTAEVRLMNLKICLSDDGKKMCVHDL